MPYFGFMDNVVNLYLQSKLLMENGIQIITIKHKIWDRICICQTFTYYMSKENGTDINPSSGQ